MEFADSEASSRLVMFDGAVLTKCDQCRDYYADLPDKEPPCETCRVDLMEENEEVANVFMVCRNQVIMVGMSGQVIDINLPAVFGVMDRYPGGIKDQWRCMTSVRRLFNHLRAKGDNDAN